MDPATIKLNSTHTHLSLSESAWSLFAVTRFVLATIVYISHLRFFGPLPSALQSVVPFGGINAVLGFLMISGISIGHSYRTSSSQYFKRRFLRIYPLYFFAVLSSVFVQYYIGSPYVIPGQTLVAAGPLTSTANFIFLQGFAAITITYNGPLWSLAVEVFFYLLVPFLTRVPKIFIYLLIFGSLGFYTASLVFPSLQKSYLFGYLALIYAWPWLLGFLISGNKQFKILAATFIIALLAVYITRIESEEPLGWITVGIVGLIVLLSIKDTSRLPAACKKVFYYLGELSYPLYLFHTPLYLLLYHAGVRNAWLFCGLLFIIIIPLNYLLDHWLKKIFWKPLIAAIEKNFSRLNSGFMSRVKKPDM